MKASGYSIAALLGFLAGAGLFLLWQPPQWLILVGMGVGLGSIVLWRWSRTFIHLGWLGLFVLFFFLGMGRSTLAIHSLTPDQVDFYNGQEVILRGVVRQVDLRQEQVKYTLKVEELEILGEEALSYLRVSNGIRGEVLVSLGRHPRYTYGDRLSLKGELLEPGKMDTFHYGNYLSRFGLYSVMYWPDAQKEESGLGHWFWRLMIQAQDGFLVQISKLFPEPYASFEAGLLVGARKGIPKGLMEQFNVTGLTHIIAISGYNITIIIVFVMWILRSLPRKIQFFMAVGAIVLFTLFVGASPAVVRASIMGILGLLALQTGRQGNVHLLVLFTAFLMVLWNPKILWWDVGFQLSFAAVLGLIYVAPCFSVWAEKIPQTFGMREAIQMTISAQIAALPIIVYNFNQLSLISPLSNVLVAFAIPPAMAFGFVAVLLSFIYFPLGLPFAYGAYLFLAYIIKIIELTAALPYASVELPGMQLWMMFGYYGALGGFLLWKKRMRAPEKASLLIPKKPVDSGSMAH